MDELDGLNRYITNGYYQYYMPNHHLANKAGLVYEHMIIAEKMLGRKLKKGEVVHHKDRNRLNNSLYNLMVFKTNSDHHAFHAGKAITKDNDVYIAINKNKYNEKHQRVDKCPICGKEKYATAKMCLECWYKYKAKNIPSKEELYTLLFKNSMCAIGRIYNVSDNAVRKWCKKYNLPYKKSDIDKLKK